MLLKKKELDESSDWTTDYVNSTLRDLLTDWLTARLTIELTVWQTVWLSDCTTDCVTDFMIARLPAWLTDYITDWLYKYLTDCRTDYVIIRLYDWLTDWLTGWLYDWLTVWMSHYMADWLYDSLNGWLYDCLTDWLIILLVDILFLSYSITYYRRCRQTEISFLPGYLHIEQKRLPASFRRCRLLGKSPSQGAHKNREDKDAVHVSWIFEAPQGPAERSRNSSRCEGDKKGESRCLEATYARSHGDQWFEIIWRETFRDWGGSNIQNVLLNLI